MNRTIEIVISPTGETVIQTKGFRGSSCREATQRLEQALGKATREEPTAEFYQQTTVRRQSTAKQ